MSIINLKSLHKPTYNDPMGPSIVAASNSSKAFLPSSVPLKKKGSKKEGFQFYKGKGQYVSLKVKWEVKKERTNCQVPTAGARWATV